jgi:hypothetical protein
MSARSERIAFLCIAAFSCALTAGPILVTKGLYHDNLGVYAYALAHFDSLNRFGELAWWSPDIDMGFPTYFYTLLGVGNAGKPAFVLVGALIWLLGRVGIHPASMVPAYVLYFGVVVPLLYMAGVRCLALRVLRSQAARLYVLVAAAFSPGVIMNLSDPGVLEYTAYCLFFAAAWARFVAHPDARAFLVLCLTAGLVSLAFSQYLLMTAIPWLPLLVLTSVVALRTARRALRTVPLGYWAGGAALVVVCAAPSAIAYLQGRDELIQYAIESGFEYPYGRLKAGNPLEFLLASTPAVAFEWDRYDQEEGATPSNFDAHALAPGRHGSFNYLGLIALPLAALGLVHGRRRLRVPLSLLLALATIVLALSSYSPIFSVALALPSPLRSMNHYGDLLYRGGGFLLIVLAAGLGLEALERRPALFRWLPALCAASGAATFLAWRLVGAPAQSLVGLALALMACFAILFARAWQLPARRRARLLFTGVVLLTLVDVSTFAFWHLRLVIVGPTQGEGVRGPLDRPSFTQNVLIMRRIAELKDLPLDRLPRAAGFCAAHGYVDRPTQADLERAIAGERSERSLALPAALASEPSLHPFFARGNPGACEARFKGEGAYNERRVIVAASQPTLALFRETYSKHWSATVDGAPTTIHPALGAFQAVVVPAGRSEVRLRFRPPFIGLALVVAYALLALLAAFLLRRPVGAGWAWSARGRA